MIVILFMILFKISLFIFHHHYHVDNYQILPTCVLNIFVSSYYYFDSYVTLNCTSGQSKIKVGKGELYHQPQNKLGYSYHVGLGQEKG